MLLVTLLKYVFIMLVATIILLGTPIIVGLFTMRGDILMLSLFLGGAMAGIFVVCISPVILGPTIKYWNKKQKEKEAIKNE